MGARRVLALWAFVGVCERLWALQWAWRSAETNIRCAKSQFPNF